MTSPIRRFLDTWHDAVAKRDVRLLESIIHDDCVLFSPVVWTPKTGKGFVMWILQGVIANVESFSYRSEWLDEANGAAALEFEGHIGGMGLVGVDLITLGADGRMIRLEVLIRPLNTLQIFAERMDAHVRRGLAALAEAAEG